MNLAAAAAIAGLLAMPMAATAATPPPLVIPVIVSQTGPASFVGKDEVVALAVLEKYVNAHGGVHGQPVHFDTHDDTSDPKISVQLLNQIIASTHPAVVLGSTLTATCGAIAALAKDTGPVTYCFSPGLSAERGTFAFASSGSLKTSQDGIWTYARLKGYRRIAVISGIDASGIANEKVSKDLAAAPINRDLQIVAQENLAPDAQSAAAQVTRIKAAHPDVIMAWVTGAPFGTLLRSLADAGLDIPITTTGANANVEQLSQYAQFLPKELVLPGFPYNLGEKALRATDLGVPATEFFQAYRDAGVVPSPAASPYVWDMAHIVLSAYQTLGPAATAPAIRDYIEGLRHFVGMNGVYDFSSGDQHGLTAADTVMVRFNPKSGGFEAVSKLGGTPN